MKSALVKQNFITRGPRCVCCCSRGFCYFNSVAIAAKLLQQRLNVNKILIVDWVSLLRNRVSLRPGGTFRLELV